MKSLKDVLKKKGTQWQQAHTTSLTKYTVVPLIHSSVEELLTSRPEVISNKFRHDGLVPWIPVAVDEKKMLASSVFWPPVLLESNVSQDLIDPQPGPLDIIMKGTYSNPAISSSRMLALILDLFPLK